MTTITTKPIKANKDYAIRAITADQHEAYLSTRPAASFLQNPHWGEVKSEWRNESVGIYHKDDLVGASLILYRPLPVVNKIPVIGNLSLAYISEGPVVNADVHISDVLPALTSYVKKTGAFELRLGLPETVRRWDADVVRKALKDDQYEHLMELQADVDYRQISIESDMVRAGFKEPSIEEDFGNGQPMFQARVPIESDAESVLMRMNQTSRSETRKSLKQGLIIKRGASLVHDFHSLYVMTAEREQFTPRPVSYFERLLEVFDRSEIAHAEVIVAYHEDIPLAAALTIRQGDFLWYLYGGSSAEHRKMYASRAVQWEMITDAVKYGCKWYDLIGVPGSLKANGKTSGLTMFKTAVGADVVQTHGEWSRPLIKPLSLAFNAYLNRR